MQGWRSMLSANRLRTILGLARGLVEHAVEAFDADPDLLNTSDGVVLLREGRVVPHDPDLRLTKIFRRFLDTTARVIVAADRITVQLPRRAHNPILIDAGLIGRSVSIPWWSGRPLRLEIV